MNPKQAKTILQVIDGMQMNIKQVDFQRIFGEDTGNHICRKFNDPTSPGYHNLAALMGLLDLQNQSLMAHEINTIFMLVNEGYSPLEALEEQHSKYHSWQWLQSGKNVAGFKCPPR